MSGRADPCTPVATRAVLLTLVPNSGLQFIDFTMSLEMVAHTRRRFLEEAIDGGDPSLHVATSDGGVFYHPLTNEPCDPARTYMVGGVDALAPFLGQWLPVPFMRVSHAEDGDGLRLDEGPSNWTRVHITRAGEGADLHFRVVLAIDTAIDDTAAGPARGYVAPTLSDLEAGGAFRFSDAVDDVAWFVSEAWVDDWIRELYDGAEGRLAVSGSASTLQHLARYLTVLSVLREACELPAVRFMSPAAIGAYAQTVPVDLALDLGTSRSVALIEERHPASRDRATGTSPARSTIRGVPLRNLREPWQSSDGPFPSKVIFSRANFGSEALSRWSGRTGAFHWPSPVRTGAEAQALGAGDDSGDNITGVSSPMHYVWDERVSRHVWRFTAGTAGEAGRRNPVVSGTLLAHVAESGDVVDDRAGQAATTKPRFSRSSLVTLQVAEILLHAIAAINAPRQRETAPQPAAARRLDRILVAPPSGMGEAETAILRRRVEAAVKLVWQTMGWAREGHPLAPPRPAVTLAVDAATATQLAYLENEIAHKFGGRADALLTLIGKGRPGFQGARTLRIATLDIGGATSGLSVATYEPAPGNGLAVNRLLVDGFETGSSSIVQAIARRVIVAALECRLEECKHGAPAKFLSDILGSNERARPAWVGNLGRRLSVEMLEPAAVALLRLYAKSDIDAGDAQSELSIATLLASLGTAAQPAVERTVADQLDVAAADDGADGFAPLEVIVPFTMREIGRIARDVLGPMLDSVVRVLAALDCDIVLLGGSGASLPAVREAILSGMPLRPDRIVALDEHRFGPWLPSPSGSTGVVDVRPLPAVGALIEARGTFGSGGPEIVMRPRDRASASGFIGCLSRGGMLSPDDVLFDPTGETAVGTRTPQPGRSRPVFLHLPALIGFRQPSLASWPARPMWIIERAPEAGGRPPKMPLKVVLELKPAERGRSATIAIVSAVDGDGGRLDPAELVVRLKTRSFAGGHWLDTGHLLTDSTGMDA